MRTKWTKEAIIDKAKECSNKIEFTKLYGGAYNASKKLGIFEEVCQYFTSDRILWNEEKVLIEATKYTNKRDFRKYSRAAYEASVRFGIAKFTKHMKSLRKHWTVEEAFTEAKKYNYRGDFLNGSSGAYKLLYSSNLLDKACKHMWNSSDNLKWNRDSIIKEALRYNTRNTFKVSNSGAYQAMQRLGITEEVCKHMEKPKCIKYTLEELTNEALKYKTKSEFKRESYGMYQASCKHPEFDNFTSHMEEASKFSMLKPSILYYFKIMLDNNPIWKIGITNYSVEDRYYRRDIDRMEDIIEIPFSTGAEAYNAEQAIMKTYKNFKYSGPTPFTDGTSTTECFKVDISKEEFFINLKKN